MAGAVRRKATTMIEKLNWLRCYNGFQGRGVVFFWLKEESWFGLFVFMVGVLIVEFGPGLFGAS
jgi:hypothetical protein